jgi:hypothetical protein
MARISILLGNAMFAQFTKEEETRSTSENLPSATPQRGMFPEIAHSQSLLGALVFPKNFSS